MQSILVIDFEKCTGCRICEMYCSLLKTKTCNPERARIRVIKWEEQGINAPAVCQQCEDAPCMRVCPVNAISIDHMSGLVAINYDMCIGCKMCMVVCPFGSISIDPVEHRVFKCDLCEGDPMCARVCPTEAIKFLRADRVSLNKRREGIEKLAELTKLIEVRKSGGEGE